MSWLSMILDISCLSIHQINSVSVPDPGSIRSVDPYPDPGGQK
jgi:hypothetical protein